MTRLRIVLSIVSCCFHHWQMIRQLANFGTNAAYALGEIGGKQAFEALMSATDDPDGFVREAVFQSLKRIDAEALERSGKSFR